MLNQFIKLAIKVLIKNKYYTIINVFGLVLGMISVLIISKYIGGSLHFDDFHLKKDQIHEIKQAESKDGKLSNETYGTYWGVGEIINEQFPQVIRTARYYPYIESLVLAENETNKHTCFNENKIFIVDSNFLKIFTFPLILGDKETALSHFNSIILTKSSSQKFFGNTNPVGKLLIIRTSWGEETRCTVKGVVDDPPKKSQFQFDFLISKFSNTELQWDVPDYKTFLFLDKTTNSIELEKQLTDYLNKLEPLRLTNRKVTLSLESIADVRLTNTEYLLVIVAIFILLISWVNFINQNISQSYSRFKEIGILKVTGSSQTNLVTQFAIEAFLVCIVSLTAIIIIYLLLEPLMQEFTSGHMLPLTGDSSVINYSFLTIFIIGILLSAAIPSVILHPSKLSTTLQKGYSGKIGSLKIRKALVILQFFLSSILIISIVLITNQLNYMNNIDKGIDLNNTIVVKSPKDVDNWEQKIEKLKLFKEKCAMLPFVERISSSSTVPGEEYRQETFLGFQGKDDKILVYVNTIDDNFLNMYNAKFITGNNFMDDTPWKNRRCIIINETAAKSLGIANFNSAINKTLVVDGENKFELIGIIKDYHKTSLKNEIRPMAFLFQTARGHFSLKISNNGIHGEIEDKLSAVKNIWSQVYPDVPFDYYFLNEKFKSQNKKEIYFGKLFKLFTAISIIISCIGLFGFSLIVSSKRQKEIGVRKVFGASSFKILSNFIKGYLGPILTANIIGVPVACFLMVRWLSNFAYRIDIGFWSVFLAVLCLILIFLLTISFHTIKTSKSNPVEVLKE